MYTVATQVQLRLTPFTPGSPGDHKDETFKHNDSQVVYSSSRHRHDSCMYRAKRIGLWDTTLA